MIGVLVTIAQPRAPQHEQRPPWWVSVVQHLEPHPSLFRLGWVRVRACWYARRDSNPHARRHQDLNLGRLPIPPLALCRAHSTDLSADSRMRRPCPSELSVHAQRSSQPLDVSRRPDVVLGQRHGSVGSHHHGRADDAGVDLAVVLLLAPYSPGLHDGVVGV